MTTINKTKVYFKTELGQHTYTNTFEMRSKQRVAFMLFDDTRTLEEVFKSTSKLGVTWDDLEYLVTKGFVEMDTAGVTKSAPASTSTSPSAKHNTSLKDVRDPKPSSVEEPAKASLDSPKINTKTPAERYSIAAPLATQLTASLGLRGFMLNMKVSSASGYEDLVELFPKISDAVGAGKAQELKRALGL